VNLTKDDAALFFRLMWDLQFYVNRKLNILPDIGSAEDYARLGREAKRQVRDALYQHPDLIDDFVAENPANLSFDELQIIQSWKHHVAGSFFILRFLKRYAVFILSDKVYGVLGLYDSLQDIFHGQPLPIWAEAVLLPFKGRIVYDGLLISRNIIFGAGIRGDLNETYQAARQNGKIIESLEPGAEPAGKPKPRKPARDWTPVLDGVVETTEQLKQAESVMQTRAFGVLKASAKLAQAAARDPENLNEIAQQAKSVQRALRQLDTALSRAGWYKW